MLYEPLYRFCRVCLRGGRGFAHRKEVSVDIFLSYTSGLYRFLQRGIASQVVHLSTELQPCAVLMGFRFIVDASDACETLGRLWNILNLAKLCSLYKSCTLSGTSSSISLGTVTAHGLLVVGQRIGGFVCNRAAIAEALPKLNLPLSPAAISI